MNALLDTNILVDFLAKRPLFFNNDNRSCSNSYYFDIILYLKEIYSVRQYTRTLLQFIHNHWNW